MVNGAFCCLGSPQQLKSRYGEGYRLKVRVSGVLEPIKEFVRQNFDSAILKVSAQSTCAILVSITTELSVFKKK